MQKPREPAIWRPEDASTPPRLGDSLRLFALDATAELGRAVARSLGCELAAHEERSFEDGEHKVRPLDNAGGADVYVVQSLHGGPT